MIKKKWIKREYPLTDIEAITKKFSVSSLITKVLLSRGLNNHDEISKFLYPSIKNLNDPYLLSDVEKGAEVVFKYIKENRKIFIFGDYDVDGITSTSLLYNFFNEIGYKNFDIYLPSRINDSYGMTKKAIDIIGNAGGELIITVDCGSSNEEEIIYAKKEE